jgi:hypothetical protein
MKDTVTQKSLLLDNSKPKSTMKGMLGNMLHHTVTTKEK